MFAHDWHQIETTFAKHRITIVRCRKCREEKSPQNLACKQQKGHKRSDVKGPSGRIAPPPLPAPLAAPHAPITHCAPSGLYRIDLRTRVRAERNRTDVPTGKHAIAKRLGISWRQVTGLFVVTS